MTADLSLPYNLTTFTLLLKSQFLLVQGNVSRNTKYFCRFFVSIAAGELLINYKTALNCHAYMATQSILTVT